MKDFEVLWLAVLKLCTKAFTNAAAAAASAAATGATAAAAAAASLEGKGTNPLFLQRHITKLAVDSNPILFNPQQQLQQQRQQQDKACSAAEVTPLTYLRRCCCCCCSRAAAGTAAAAAAASSVAAVAAANICRNCNTKEKALEKLLDTYTSPEHRLIIFKMNDRSVFVFFRDYLFRLSMYKYIYILYISSCSHMHTRMYKYMYIISIYT